MSRLKAPTVGRNVVVRTAEKIGGQNEHAAIVTRVLDGDLIDVMLFAAGDGAQPYSITRIFHVDNPHAGAVTWRWPSGA
jgi:hypothetical protein